VGCAAGEGSPIIATVGSLLDGAHARAWELCSQVGDSPAGGMSKDRTGLCAAPVVEERLPLLRQCRTGPTVYRTKPVERVRAGPMDGACDRALVRERREADLRHDGN